MIIRALRLMAQKNVDYVDAVIAEEARESGSAVASFDEDFRKLNVALRRV